jgi:hypothetical protein
MSAFLGSGKRCHKTGVQMLDNASPRHGSQFGFSSKSALEVLFSAATE